MIARSVGWRRILFIDDDITVSNVEDLRGAAALTDRFDAVGLRNHGYPDNSVVCHANRLTSPGQEAFVGGGAMAVKPHTVDSFFPEIYNEDWLFLLKSDHLAKVAACGTVIQQAYDPFDDPGRARREEFGDCIAEGLFSRLDQKKGIHGADKAFWTLFLADRRLLIKQISNQVQRMFTGTERDRMLASLEASERSRAEITPAECVDYLQAWERDRRLWRARLAECHTTDSIHEAVEAFGIPAANVHQSAVEDPRR